MSADRILFTGVPTLLTIALHAGVALVLLLRWSGPAEVVAAVPTLQPVQATLVQAESLKPKPTPKKSQAAPKPKPKPKPKTDPEPVVQPQPNPVPEQLPPPKAENNPLDAQQLAMLTRQELDSLVDGAPGEEAAQSASMRDIVAAGIQAAVVNRWTRPPSARNGMVAVLSIQLVPTGEVVGVGVLESSGNSAFDRSAMTAVERVARFPEVAKLDNRLFESSFRRFQLVFKPEDLRY
jgi:colicin import membrane protein